MKLTKKELMNKLKRYLSYIKKERNINNKRIICEKMFSILLENSWYLELYPTLKETIRLKLIEFATIANQKFARDYYKKIFNETIDHALSK
jgi:hypothetical protein